MKKYCFINQPVGLGDIIFCQKIGHHFHNKGYSVKWPVRSEYLDTVRKYIDSPFEFTEWTGIPTHNVPMFEEQLVYLPLNISDMKYPQYRIMEAKYIVSEVNDFSDWVSYFNINRDYKKEDELFNILGLKEDDRYVLVNTKFGSPPDVYNMDIEITGSIKQVHVEFIDGFSIFDWCKVIEHASQICITDSAMALIVEKLKPTRVEKFTILSRRSNTKEIDLMYNLNWNYIVRGSTR